MNMISRGEFRRKDDGAPIDEGAIAADMKAATQQLKSATDQVKRFAEEAERRVKAGEDLTAETKAAVDKLLPELDGLRSRVAEAEQKLSRGTGGGAGEQAKSYGQQLIASEQYAGFAKSENGRMRMVMKAITSANVVVEPHRDREVVTLPQRDLYIRDLLDVVPTTSSSIEYTRQKLRTNAAAPVAEGAAKPYSQYEWEKKTTPVRTIAHLAKLTRQAVDDDVQLAGEVDSEMRYGLSLTEEAQILQGDGTGENLLGLIPQATAYANPAAGISDSSPIDRLRLAILQGELALYPVDGIVLNPIDWAVIELSKDGQQRYIFANPTGLAGPRLWSKPVVSTPAITVDKFLVGGFKQQRLYDRMEIEVLLATENTDDFEKNMVTMRAEKRLALAVRKPAALTYGDLGRVA